MILIEVLIRTEGSCSLRLAPVLYWKNNTIAPFLKHEFIQISLLDHNPLACQQPLNNHSNGVLVQVADHVPYLGGVVLVLALESSLDRPWHTSILAT
jgi:hypothetical protein